MALLFVVQLQCPQQPEVTFSLHVLHLGVKHRTWVCYFEPWSKNSYPVKIVNKCKHTISYPGTKFLTWV
jgi:hypothetical protein